MIALALVAGLVAVLPTMGRGGDLTDWLLHRDQSGELPLEMKQLAHTIREIDDTLFRKGIIGVKAPDVWGQNRMTKYRAEYENVMVENNTKFSPMLQAARRRTDVTALTNAMGISAGLSPGAAPSSGGGVLGSVLGGRRHAAAPPAVVPLAATAAMGSAPSVTLNLGASGSTSAPSASSSGGSNASAAGAGASGSSTSSDPTLPDLTDIAARIDKMQQTVLNLPSNIVNFAAKPGDPGVGIEPVLQLDEQSRFLNHLHLLRRNSAGDDLTDLPGYGLYLIRMPISIMPGKEVRKGKGAVVTVEAKLDLTDDLLENTIRDVVTKDVLYKLKEPVLWAIRGNLRPETAVKSLTTDEGLDALEHGWKEQVLKVQKDLIEKQAERRNELAKLQQKLMQAVKKAEAPEGAAEDAAASKDTASKVKAAGPESSKTTYAMPPGVILQEARAAQAEKSASSSDAKDESTGADSTTGKNDDDESASASGSSGLGLPLIGYGVSGPSPAGEPSSEFLQILGTQYLTVLSQQVESTVSGNEMAMDSAVFSWLDAEIQNAYRFMRQAIFEADQARSIGAESCRVDQLFRAEEIEQLAEALLCRDYPVLTRRRSDFLAKLYFRRYKLRYFDETRYMSGLPQDKAYRITIDRYVLNQLRPLDVLCYMVLAQLIFVDRQIKQDMRILHDRRGFAYAGVADRLAVDGSQGPGLRFYDFRPAPEAKHLFKEYVRCKWPIHVYALDPDIDQQNILDAFSQRTELQLALSVALAAGKVNFSDAAKFARQLDLDLTTIGLNRTAVGFGAGRSTFGWRFYPRVQTPPTPSNPARFLGTLLYNGTRPGFDLANRELEPGNRECVAVMVVPDFVPAIRLTSQANWFGLTDHSEQEISPGELLKLSRKLQTARQTLACTREDTRYRPGELARMAERIDQLENMLPTQDFRVDLPDEGDFSGSEIFSSDAANLSPTLLTWFGEPPTVGKVSDVFLLGKGFSVIESQVIAGGLKVQQDLISRNVIRIRIPADARTVEIADSKKGPRKAFDVHLATPNGISDYHLAIPAKEEKEKEPAFGYTVDTKTLDVTIEYWSVAPSIPGKSAPKLHVRGLVPADAKVKVSLKETIGAVPAFVQLNFALPKIQGKDTTAYRARGPVPFDPVENGFTLNSPELTGLAHHIAMIVIGSGIDPANPPPSFKTLTLKPVKVRPFLGGRWGTEVSASKSLQINVKFELGSPRPSVPTPVLVHPRDPHANSCPPGASGFACPAAPHSRSQPGASVAPLLVPVNPPPDSPKPASAVGAGRSRMSPDFAEPDTKTPGQESSSPKMELPLPLPPKGTTPKSRGSARSAGPPANSDSAIPSLPPLPP